MNRRERKLFDEWLELNLVEELDEVSISLQGMKTRHLRIADIEDKAEKEGYNLDKWNNRLSIAITKFENSYP